MSAWDWFLWYAGLGLASQFFVFTYGVMFGVLRSLMRSWYCDEDL